MRAPKKKKTILNPQQSHFLSYYVDPKSETRGNALQSALKAGYAQEYAENITFLNPDWLSENIGSKNPMLVKAERNLDAMLDLEPERTLKDKDGKEYKKYSTEILKVKSDITKFVASTVGKARYSPKTDEITNRTLVINITGETAARYNILPKNETNTSTS